MENEIPTWLKEMIADAIHKSELIQMINEVENKNKKIIDKKVFQNI